MLSSTRSTWSGFKFPSIKLLKQVIVRFTTVFMESICRFTSRLCFSIASPRFCSWNLVCIVLSGVVLPWVVLRWKVWAAEPKKTEKNAKRIWRRERPLKTPGSLLTIQLPFLNQVRLQNIQNFQFEKIRQQFRFDLAVLLNSVGLKFHRNSAALSWH